MNVWVKVFGDSHLAKGMKPKHRFGHKESCLSL